jgi:hypothetical protein
MVMPIALTVVATQARLTTDITPPHTHTIEQTPPFTHHCAADPRLGLGVLDYQTH